MMAQFTPFIILVAALLINTLSYCSAENVYCVTPIATSCSFCPHNSINCSTLSEYAQEAKLYFTSNTTMVFLSGDHTLDTNITVGNVSSLTMHGESSSGNRATVVCSESVGLSFTSMVDFKINSLVFTSCSRIYDMSNYSNNISILSIAHVALFLQDTQYTDLVNCSFRDNIGTPLAVTNTSITLAGNTAFAHNHCESNCIGGAIIALNSNLSFTENTTFLENSAKFNETFNIFNNFPAGCGGAIHASDNTVLSFNGVSNFINNSAYNGGAISMLDNTVITFYGSSNFISNFADYGGGAIFMSDNTAVHFIGTSNFVNNSGFQGGAIYGLNNTALNFDGTNNFTNNSAYSGGAIYTTANSILTFNGIIYFINNNGHYRGEAYSLDGYTYGGGVFMAINSTYTILPKTTVYWENNHATFGGAIYFYDVSLIQYCTPLATLIPRQECFFQLPGQNLSNGIDVKLVFKNNSADKAGSVLYGGAIDHCILTHGLDSHNSSEVFDKIVHIDNETKYNTTSIISSDPLKICPCENNLSNCNPWYYFPYYFPRTVYPGETFQVSVVAVGQRDGTVPSQVISTACTNVINMQCPATTNLKDSQYLQQANNMCTKLNYTVSSLNQSVVIHLQPEGHGPCSHSDGLYSLMISVSFYQTCPPGFYISESEKSCVCEPRLAHYTNSCTITNGVGQITREAGQQFWVGYCNHSQSDKLILHPLCPDGYCVNNSVSFPLNESDMQCANSRSGFLCGACRESYSLVLGTSRCWKCTNSYLALLVPFAVMGVALVFLVHICKLTVAAGTISGLVFYANIVGVNRTIFLPVDSTDAFSVFIAWLNLDFGIETCFYDGLDAYSKTWLQFVFPVYIWMLVGLMILVSHFSRRFANLLGKNPVTVLATLILLSYTKILRTLIAAINITYLEYPTYNRMVWLYDANIDYLNGKHIPLFIVVVLVFLFLFLPYTLLLLFGQWLQVISHLRLFSWVNSARLKPFIDSYHAPYKAKHRYWPGLLLVLRFVLFLVFALNPQEDPSINLLAILVGTGILVAWAWASGGVYRNWCLDALECSFALNLIILVGATSYVHHSGGNQYAVWCTSVSIALATFIGILAYQTFQQLRSTKLWKKVPKLNLKFNRQNVKQAVKEPADNLAVETDFSRLREPLLEDLPQPNYGAFWLVF